MLEKMVTYQQFSGYADVFKSYGPQDDVPDLSDDDIPTIVEQIRHNGAVRAALGKSNGASVVLDLPLPPECDVDDDSTSPFYKSPVIIRGDQRPTLAKKLGVVRTERVTTADGAVWIHAFNSKNELVDARVLQSGD
jgi:hypothetical protein